MIRPINTLKKRYKFFFERKNFLSFYKKNGVNTYQSNYLLLYTDPALGPSWQDIVDDTVRKDIANKRQLRAVNNE
jgi:hypothetical protein